MKLLQLRYLLAIADNGLNITAAANHLYTSQPGVSKQLRLLEEELGVQLFVRNGRSLVAITTAGNQIIAHARLIMREVECIRSFARGLRHESENGSAEDGSSQVANGLQSGLTVRRCVTAIRKRPF